jgi:tetratricopeptide (TPR) repeat protein
MSAKIGRNDACSCGSGKKYKKCCGRPGAVSAGAVIPAPAPPSLPSMAELLRARRYAELEAQVRAALAKHPDRGTLWKFLGAALHAQQRDSLEALQAAARLLPEDPEAQTNLGNVLRARGRLDGAAERHRRAILLNPLYAEAHANLGSVLHDLGQLEAAAASFREATRLKPQLALAHHNLGIVLRELGRMEEALGAHRRALALMPDSAGGHAQLSRALADLGRRKEAEASLQRALGIEPQRTEEFLHLADALLALERFDAAAEHYQRLLSVQPELPEARANLALALRETGQLQAAHDAYERALKLRPKSAEMHNSLGSVLLDLGRLEEAAASYLRALELNPGLAKAHENLGTVLRELDRPEEAEASLAQALALEPGSTDILTHLAITQRLQGRAVEAEVNIKHALELDPACAPALIEQANVAMDRGEFEIAEKLYREVFARDSNSADAWSNIVATRRMTPEDGPWFTQAEELTARPRLPRELARLRFAMGKYLDDIGEYHRAFANYRLANELVRTYRPHDRREVSGAFEFIRQRYDAQWIDSARTQVPMERQPILIVGMARSGTSLAEQILASHAAVFGAGELSFWGRASRGVAAASLESGTEPALLGSLAAEYDALLATLPTDRRYVVDKMPGNFAHLGLIHAALPGARIIHMQRHPIDTGLSIYFQYFRVGHSYAYDLDDIAHYYDEYRRLMSHWLTVLPRDTILEVPYEALVAQPELWSRRMVEFAGLPWDEACLDFHRARRTVRTVSRWQVRQKISTGSVERWRRYATHVGPLLRLDPA